MWICLGLFVVLLLNDYFFLFYFNSVGIRGSLLQDIAPGFCFCLVLLSASGLWLAD